MPGSTKHISWTHYKIAGLIYTTTKKCIVCSVLIPALSFPLTKKNIPVATPSSPRVRPTPQNTEGPRLGSDTSTSEEVTHPPNTPPTHTHAHHTTMCSHTHPHTHTHTHTRTHTHTVHGWEKKHRPYIHKHMLSDTHTS